MTFLEKNLEDILFDANNQKIAERGLFLYGKKKRQVRIGNYGIADLVAYYTCDEKLFITVYELKKDKVGIETLLQAMNYVKGIDWYLKRRNFSFETVFRIKLIGKEIDTGNSFCYFPDFFPNVELITYEYKFDGIRFYNHNGFKLTNDGFGMPNEIHENNSVPEPF